VAAPVVADPLVGVDDQAFPARALQVVRRGEAGLARANDQGLDVLGVHLGLLW
jgi:hypothetical protein